MAISRYGVLADVPDSQWVNGVNNWQACNAVMKNPQWYGSGSGSFADAVSRMFSPGYFESWETFASTIHNSPKNLKDNPSEGVSADSPAAKEGDGHLNLFTTSFTYVKQTPGHLNRDDHLVLTMSRMLQVVCTWLTQISFLLSKVIKDLV